MRISIREYMLCVLVVVSAARLFLSWIAAGTYTDNISNDRHLPYRLVFTRSLLGRSIERNLSPWPIIDQDLRRGHYILSGWALGALTTALLIAASRALRRGGSRLTWITGAVAVMAAGVGLSGAYIAARNREVHQVYAEWLSLPYAHLDRRPDGRVAPRPPYPPVASETACLAMLRTQEELAAGLPGHRLLWPIQPPPFVVMYDQLRNHRKYID